jgi:hypothetical protein
MRYCWILFALGVLAMTSPASGQSVVGCVVDAEHDTPLPGTHITTPTAGTVADSTGCFELALSAGSHRLTARMLGYETQRRSIMLSADARIRVAFRLTPEAIPLRPLEVVADRPAPRDVSSALTTLTPAVVATLPGASEDVLRALQATPSVVSASDFSSQLIVRGSRPDENLITIDGVEIFNPHRLHGVVSVFNPALLADATLHAGGFPARYGDRLSAVLAVETRSGTRQDWLRGSVNASLSNTNLVLEGRTGLWDGAWIVAGRRTYYDLILDALGTRLGSEKQMTFPNFADVQGKLTLSPTPIHRIDAGMLAGRDALDMTMRGAGGPLTAAADRIQADEASRNDLAYVRWRWTPARPLALTTTVSGYRNRGTARSDGQIVPQDRLVGTDIVPSLDTTEVFSFDRDRRFRLRKLSLQHRVRWSRGWHRVEAGAHLDRLHTAFAYELATSDVGYDYLDVLQRMQPLGLTVLPGLFDRSHAYGRYALYVQDRVALADGAVHLQPGMRIDHYGLIDASYLSPRFRMRIALAPTTHLQAAWGIYRQSPGIEKLMMGRDRVKLSESTSFRGLRAERATHYTAGLTHWWNRGYSVELDAYWKTMRDMITPQWATAFVPMARYTGAAPRTDPNGYALQRIATLEPTAQLTNNGRGQAYGAEILLRKRSRGHSRFSGWIAYTYARSTRSQRLTPTTKVQHPFVYDRRHTLNVAGTLHLGARWSLSARFRYGTGFPHTTPTGSTPIVVESHDGGARILTHSATGAVRFKPRFGGPEHRYTARLPAYHRLDLRLARTVDWSAIDGQFYVDVINAYNQRNVLSYQYAAVTDPDKVRPVVYQQALYMLPIVPSVGFRLQF